MSGSTAGRPSIKQIVAAIILLALILAEVAANPAYSSGPNTSLVGVSPGKFDLPLGNDFPKFGAVKLSYPDSAILTNSVGDLLFNVTLNPLMLNPTSAQVWSPALPSHEVQVWGSGFSSEDTSCTLSGIPVASAPPPTCSILGQSGNLTASFNVANAPSGSYIVTATGNPGGDYSSASFTVLPTLPPSLVLNPSFGPDGTSVSVSGAGFYSTDTTCTLIGSGVGGIPVPPASPCTIMNGVLTGTFFVTGPPPPPPAPFSITYTITAMTNGGDSGEASTFFAVTTTPPPPAPQEITLSPSIAPPGATISVMGSGFSLSDTSCSFLGIPVGPPTSCTISGGMITSGSFVVANVPPGTYSITATGSSGDMATYRFQVLAGSPSGVCPSGVCSPSSPISAEVEVDIYIPPDFSGLTTSNLWTSFTNNYDGNSMRLSKQFASDQIAPSWWKISIFNIIVTRIPSAYKPPIVSNRIFVVNVEQYIRLFQVTSPPTAGRYFFKAFINDISIGAENFPTLVVKASRDPAYISGVLRDAGYRYPSRAGEPINLTYGTGARVLATGLDYLGRSVSAQTYINSTADGNYTLFGVAPGTYNITAYAAGYEPATRPWTVSVAAAQSLGGVDVYLVESVNITGTVLSKDADGNLIPWGTLAGVTINGTESTVPRAITVNLLNLQNGTVGSLAAQTPAPYLIKTFTNPTSTSFGFALQNEVGFDGHIPQDYANYTSGLVFGDYILQAYVTSYIQLDEVRVHVDNETIRTFSTIPLIRTGQFNVTVHFRNSQNSTIEDNPINACSQRCTLTVSAYDMQGILRAQNVTFVSPGVRSASVELQGFSSARGFGTPSLFQPNYGLLPGTYYLTANVTSSPSIAGNANLGIATLYYQTSNTLGTIGLGDGTVDISFSLYKAGGILLSLYSIDYQIPPLFEPWRYPGKTVSITIVPTFSLQSVFQTNSTQPAFNATLQAENPVYGVHYNARLTFTLVGLQTGSYVIYIRTLGYTQRELLHVNAILGWNIDAPIWMIQNPVIDLTVAFRDESLLTFIDSTLPFAQPINNLTATPARVEVFDELGNFVAANNTYIPNNMTHPTYQTHFVLAGFDRYFGDPRDIWSGFYDTTDGASQNAGGLILYPWSLSPRIYTIRIWIDGYYQLAPLQVIVTPPQNVSVVTFVDRASRIFGTVMGPDYFGVSRRLSWATITLEPNNNTLTDIIDVQPGGYTTSSLDGSFQVWVPQGTYGMGVALEGYATYSALVAVPEGSNMYMYIWLDNYQPSSQLILTSASNSSNIGLGIKAYLRQLPNPWIEPS